MLNRLNSLYLSIRWKYIIPFALIAALVSAVLLPVVSGLVARRIGAAADDRLQETAASVSVLIDQSKQQAELSASFVANLPEVRAAVGDADALGEVLPARRDALDLQELSYYDGNYQSGDTPLYYGGPLSTRRFQVSQEVEFQREQLIRQVLLTGVPASTIVVAPQGSEIIGVAAVAESPSPGERPDGVIVAIIFIDDAYIAGVSEVLGADLAIVRDNGIVVSTIDRGTGYEQLVKEGFISPDGQITSTNLEVEGTTKGGGSARLLAAPLHLDGRNQGSVLVAQSINEFVQVQRDIQTAVLGLSAALVLATVIFGVASYLNFARPITDLATAAEKVSNGDFSPRVNPHIFIRDELTDLGQNFNLMTERLHGLYTNLEHQVAERTSELVEERNKLDRALRELAIARDEALEANRTKSAFLANMSHELRTPLNSILGYTELLIQGLYGQMTDKQVDRMQKVMSNGRHLLELINDILDLSKIEAGRMELRVEPFELRQIVDQCTAAVEPMARNKGIDLVVKLPDDLPNVAGDKNRTFQVLMNLASNAIKFTTEGAVTIYSHIVRDRAELADAPVDLSKLKGPWVLIGVDDTGIGIPPDQQARVFDEFHQVDNSSTRRFEGTGLGLAISRRLIHMMNGEIWVESAPGEGSTFFVLLPMTTEKVPVQA